MTRAAAIKMPRLPAAARKAGATQIARCGYRTFAVGFMQTGDDLDAPGRGQAVVDALRATLGDTFDIEWKGEQRYGVILTAR